MFKIKKSNKEKDIRKLAEKFKRYRLELEKAEKQVKELESRMLEMLERLNKNMGADKQFRKKLKSLFRQVKKSPK